MVEDALFSKTSFNNQSADVKGTKWSTIKSWGGGGGADKNLSGQIIYFQFRGKNVSRYLNTKNIV